MDDIGISATLARIQQIQATMASAGAGTATATATADPASGTSSAASFAAQLAQAQVVDAMSSLGGDGSSDGTSSSTDTTSQLMSLLQQATGGSGTGAAGTGATSALTGLTSGQVVTLSTPSGQVPVMVLGQGATGVTGLQGASTAATGYVAPAGATAGTAGPTGQRIAAIATAELGQRESPSGSNDGPRIAEYRTATRGAAVGPWCSYFTSWVGRQAGVPVGDGGTGLGWVPDVKSWGERTGRWIPSGAATPAQAGDLVVFDRNGDGVTDHIGVVTGVRPDGGITTVEGNSSDAVSARSYSRGQWSGLVRMAAPGA